MANNLMIISIDALNAKDYDYIKDLSIFKTFIENGSVVKSVNSVYPTLTYCCHTSIVTGTYPDKHGIFHNELYDPSRYMIQNWYWHSKHIKVPTIFDLAKQKGLKSAALLWPVTAGNKSIQYNVPEIWSDTGESSSSLFLKNGSLKLLSTVLKHSNKLDGKKQPNVDNFTEAIALDLIGNKKIDLFVIHLTELDVARHQNGVFSKEAYDTLTVVNSRLTNIINRAKETGTYDNTNFILLGDHGGNDFDKLILLNSLFVKEGLIEVNAENEIINWDAYTSSAGGSVHVHLKTASDSQIYKQVKKILRKISEMPDSPVKEFYTREDTKAKHHLFGTFSFVLEAKDGYVFRNNIEDEWIVSTKGRQEVYCCDHGFNPEHSNLKTMLLAMGPDIKSGVVVDSCSLVDEGPTIAKLLDLNLSNIDGRCLSEILK